jgi:hypothetical protein
VAMLQYADIFSPTLTARAGSATEAPWSTTGRACLCCASSHDELVLPASFHLRCSGPSLSFLLRSGAPTASTHSFRYFSVAVAHAAERGAVIGILSSEIFLLASQNSVGSCICACCLSSNRAAQANVTV